MIKRERNTEAREVMLDSIRRHLAASAPHDAIRREPHAQHDNETRARRAPERDADVASTRQLPIVSPAEIPGTSPRTPLTESLATSHIEQFRAALQAVAGQCHVVTNEAQAAEVIQSIIANSMIAQSINQQERRLRVAVSDSSLVKRLVTQANLDAEMLEDAAPAQLFDCDIGITGAQWAIAETGTLVLESAHERHRLASLVPPMHIAIIEASRVRATLRDVLQTISEHNQDELSRTVTFITGSSRTSDIELTLAIGVHGPGELHVIIIEET